MKGYKLWDSVARKVVTSGDVVFDEKLMLNTNREEVDTQVETHANRTSVQVEPDDTDRYAEEDDAPTSIQKRTSCGNVRQQEPTSIVTRRGKRVSKPTTRYGFEDIVAFALVVGSGDPFCFQDTVKSDDSENWMVVISEEMEFLHKNNTWDLVEKPKDTGTNIRK